MLDGTKAASGRADRKLVYAVPACASGRPLALRLAAGGLTFLGIGLGHAGNVIKEHSRYGWFGLGKHANSSTTVVTVDGVVLQPQARSPAPANPGPGRRANAMNDMQHEFDKWVGFWASVPKMTGNSATRNITICDGGGGVVGRDPEHPNSPHSQMTLLLTVRGGK